MRRLTIIAALALAGCAGTGELLHADRFDGSIAQWELEVQPKAGPTSSVRVEGGKLVMDVAAGATAWFKQPLSGNYVVSFKRKVIMAGGPNDRVSDMNVFWMADDPANPNLFTRSGKFEEYDSVRMYYVGIGGNSNTTTRFRRYDGKGEKRLLAEHLDQGSLLEANREYAVVITVVDGLTSVAVDGKRMFSYRDPAPLRAGYFGFRTTWSRQEIDDFEVRRLK